MVSTPNFRHPAVVAKQVMTIAELSGGRFVHGIGADAPGSDARLLGGRALSPAQRADRFAEFVDLSMDLAAHHGQWWVTIGDADRPGERPEDAWRLLARQMARLAEACEKNRRDLSDIRRLVNVSRIVQSPYSSAQRFVDLVGRCQELGFTDVVVNHPRPDGAFKGERPDFLHAASAAWSAFKS